jgi:RNA polymerase sigma factor (sigma-70 family)
VKKPFFTFGFSTMQSYKLSPNWLDAFNNRKDIAFHRFYETYHPDVKRRVNEKLGVFHSETDLVNDIFFIMYKQKGPFISINSLERYMRFVTFTVCRDFLRRKMTPVINMEKVQKFYQRIEDRIKEREEAREFARTFHDLAIQTLPPKCRVIFIMSFIRDMRNKEIAAQLNISEKTVEAQITIALKRLKMAVKDDSRTMYLIKLLLPLLWAQLTSL